MFSLRPWVSARALPALEPAPPFASAAVTGYLHRDGGHIAYDDSGGRGPLIIALPGMGDLRGQYRWLRPRLVQAGFRVVTMDVRGQGDSSVDWPDYSARAVGDDALALLGHLGASQAILLGNSFAAGAALWSAQAQPGAVRGIVMVGPMVRDLPTSPWLRGMIWLGFAGRWRVRFWMAYWDSLFPLNKPADHQVYRARLAAKLAEPGRMAALRTMVGLAKKDTAALVDTVFVPMLVVMGSRDPDFTDPLAEVSWLARKTGARVAIVAGAGHYPHVEAPDQVAGDILDFITTLKG